MRENSFQNEVPTGYSLRVACAGLKKTGNDILLIVSKQPANFACLFTKNSYPAAPVLVSKEIYLREQLVSGIVANSGCANAAIGDRGIMDAWEMSKTATEAAMTTYPFLVASTGVIGERLAIGKVKEAITLALSQREALVEEAAMAIMTTDKYPKYAISSSSESKYSILGIAKGAGMIAPNMATTLVFVVTDARVSKRLLRWSLIQAARNSFNRISVDGDMSTNDSIFLLANGCSGAEVTGDKVYEFKAILERVLTSLANMIVEDGEGATKMIRVIAKGFLRTEHARAVAKSIGDSLLVKTAMYGGDPNWGRVLAAAGKTLIPLNTEKTRISFGHTVVFEGKAASFDENSLREYLTGKEIIITFEANQGEYGYEYITCDLTEKYVKINASYKS